MMSAPLLVLAGVMGVQTPPAAPDVDPQHPQSHTHVSDEIEEASESVVLEVTYTNEVIANAAGGRRRGTRYLDNLDLVLDANLDALAGLSGAKLHVYGLYNNGRSISDLVGDAQAVSNIETGTRALRLYEAWIDAPLSPQVSLRAGLYDLNSEFDALESAGLFTGSAHGIGTDISQTGANGPSIFPSTSLAARIEARLSNGWAIRAAILDGVPGDPDRPGLTTIRLGKGDGALLIGELQMPLAKGKLLLGHWRYTTTFEHIDGSHGKGNAGVYLRGEVPLLENDVRRIDGFFRIGTASGRVNMFDRFASSGVKLTGWIPGREGDELGLAFAVAATSAEYRAAFDSRNSEIAVEATYRAQLAPWLAVQPGMQYIRHPSARGDLKDAFVIGLRSEISFRISG